MVLEDGAMVDEPGLVISVSRTCTSVKACTGRTADPATSWHMAPATMMYTSSSLFLEMLRDPARSQSNRDEARSLLEARSRPDYFHLVPAMREALDDQWPDTASCRPNGEENIFVATPRLGLKSDLAELLLLESLAEEAAAGDAHSRLLIEHIEAECGATIGEVIEEQRSRVERMMADQRDQLRIHAEAVARHNQRSRLKLRGNGGDGGSAVGSVSGGDNGSGYSDSFNQSASALRSVAQLSDSVGGMSLSSAAASPSSPSAALSHHSAPCSTGALTSDRTAADEITATTNAASSAACSWTAAHRSLESLRAPGRKKYGPILKAALRFLYSLRPVSVNRGGGSHTVFHFARGGPVTLVQPHAGGRSKDGTVGAGYRTRLYHSLHSVALHQLQLGGGEAGRLDSTVQALPAAPSPVTSATLAPLPSARGSDLSS